jgi:hypothetical protein
MVAPSSAQFTVEPAEIVFTPENYNTGVAMHVTAMDDTDFEPDLPPQFLSLFFAKEVCDSLGCSVAPGPIHVDLPLNIEDDDTFGVTLEALAGHTDDAFGRLDSVAATTSGLTFVGVEGDTFAFAMRPVADPLASVTVTAVVIGDYASNLELDVTTVVFDAAAWDQTHVVAIAIVDDLHQEQAWENITIMFTVNRHSTGYRCARWRQRQRTEFLREPSSSDRTGTVHRGARWRLGPRPVSGCRALSARGMLAN